MFGAKERSIGITCFDWYTRNKGKMFIFYPSFFLGIIRKKFSAFCEMIIVVGNIIKTYSLNCWELCVIMWFKTWQIHSLIHTYWWRWIEIIIKFCRLILVLIFFFGFCWLLNECCKNANFFLIIYANPLFVLNWTAFAITLTPKEYHYQYWLINI